jgi:hypothetical protein
VDEEGELNLPDEIGGKPVFGMPRSPGAWAGFSGAWQDALPLWRGAAGRLETGAMCLDKFVARGKLRNARAQPP